MLPARCFIGIPASTSAAHDAFIAHGRSYYITQVKDTKLTKLGQLVWVNSIGNTLLVKSYQTYYQFGWKWAIGVLHNEM